MADLHDVLHMLTEQIEKAVYPNGIDQPSVIGKKVSIFEGWPIRNVLDDIVKNGNCAISVYPTESARPSPIQTDRSFKKVERETPLITVSVSGNNVLIGGIAEVGRAIMVFVRNLSYSYVVVEEDTLQTVAQNLALLIPNASVIGTIVIIDNANNVSAKVISKISYVQELGRLDVIFKISFWCPDQQTRSKLVTPVDTYLRINNQIALPDGIYSRLWPMKPTYLDSLQLQGIFRYDLNYKVMYATTNIEKFTEIGDVILNLTTNKK